MSDPAQSAAEPEATAEPSDAPAVGDRRQAPRRRALLTGKLVTADVALTIDCVIRNLTDLGAMVEMQSPQMVPGNLYLLQVKEGLAWDAEVVWRHGHRLGLKFSGNHDLNEEVGKTLRPVRRLWQHLVFG